MIEYSNINLVHNNGQNILTRVLKFFTLKFEIRICIYKNIVEHVAKLKILKLTVSSSLLNIISGENESQCYLTACIEELKNAKNLKLHNCWVTFLNLLIDHECKLVKYAGNDDLVIDFQKKKKSQK